MPAGCLTTRRCSLGVRSRNNYAGAAAISKAEAFFSSFTLFRSWWCRTNALLWGLMGGLSKSADEVASEFERICQGEGAEEVALDWGQGYTPD